MSAIDLSDQSHRLHRMAEEIDKLEDDVIKLKTKVKQHGTRYTVIAGILAMVFTGLGIPTVWKLFDGARALGALEERVAHQKETIDKMERTFDDTRLRVAAMGSPAARNCGAHLIAGRVLASTMQGLKIEVASGVAMDFIWKDTAIGDIHGQPKTWSDLRKGMFLSLCFDNDNGIMKAIRISIIPDSQLSTIEPPPAIPLHSPTSKLIVPQPKN